MVNPLNWYLRLDSADAPAVLRSVAFPHPYNVNTVGKVNSILVF